MKLYTVVIHYLQMFLVSLFWRWDVVSPLSKWYYLKNNYLTLRSKVKVQRRSSRYATHRLSVIFVMQGSPHLVKTGWLDFSHRWLEGEERENLGDFLIARKILTFLPNYRMSPYFHKTNVLHKHLKVNNHVNDISGINHLCTKIYYIYYRDKSAHWYKKTQKNTKQKVGIFSPIIFNIHVKGAAIFLKFDVYRAWYSIFHSKHIDCILS
jgi:hypothetical protein